MAVDIQCGKQGGLQVAKLFQLSGQITSVKTTAAKTLEIRVETQDVATFTPDQVAQLMAAYEKQYWIAFAEQPLRAEEIDTKAEVVERGQKTPSQRLRAVLFVLWEQKGKDGDFESYYRSKMETIIESLKGKLE